LSRDPAAFALLLRLARDHQLKLLPGRKASARKNLQQKRRCRMRSVVWKNQ
jgi:hypothetical protein